MPRLAPMPGSASAGMAPHPGLSQVLMPAPAGWITMPWRWVVAVRERAPRVAAPAPV